MRAIAGCLALAVVFAAGAWAQRGMGGGYRGGAGGGVRVGAGGGGARVGGSVAVGGAYRGGGVAVGGAYHGGGYHGGGVHVGVGVGGYPHYGYGRYPYRGYYGRGYYGGAYYPYYSYGWPSWGVGFGYSSYPPFVWDYGYGWPAYGSSPYYSYPSYPDVSVVSAYQPAQPPVVITQSYSQPAPASPVVREYSDGSSYGQDQSANTGTQGSTIYLIAMTDGIIRPALAYWVQGSTLHYLGMDHKQKDVPLDMVDRALSAQLNRERRVPFRLPQ